MKSALISLCAFAMAPLLAAQPPLPADTALIQLYPNFNPANHTARWDCSGTKQASRQEEWPCSEDSSTVAVSVILKADLREGKVERIFLVTSAYPTDEEVPDCHACKPAIGMAVFKLQSSGWMLESANPVVGQYGSWGEPPNVELLKVGGERYGILLSNSNGGQGYHWSNKHLLFPIGGTVREVWSITDEADDSGVFDPTGQSGPRMAYRSSAAFRFFVDEDTNSAPDPYYDIEVISRGTSRRNDVGPLQPENWTAIYRFRDGKYRLLKRTAFTEAQKRKAPAAHSPK